MLALEGYPAFDCTLQEEVLVVSNIMCFLGDSPMHAEITSTPNPGNSLHLCRACALSAASVKEKATLDYVRFFFMIGPTGSWVKHPPRLWEQIKTRCYEVWTMAKKPRTKTAVGNSLSTHGVKDMINRAVIDQRYEALELGPDATATQKRFLEEIKELDQSNPERLLNPYFEAPGFDGCRDTPVEILHVFLLGVVKYMVRDFMRRLSAKDKLHVKARYQSFNIDGLNIPSIQPSYLTKHFANFIGKDFCVVLQAAPFVLFKYMDDRERNLWIALCLLAPLVFQTHIEDMAIFQERLVYLVQNFLYLLAKGTAQWVNKPKIHMLLHLVDSIIRFGPASLFATEKFEGYNSTLRNASVHSNRQSPGQDIAVTFANYLVLRHILSGGFFFEKKSGRYCAAGSCVTDIFLQSITIQKSMGLNNALLEESDHRYPNIRKWKVKPADKVPTPLDLQEHLQDYTVSQIAEVNLDGKHVIRAGSFVLVSSLN
ncbi:hypothetical protein PGTUg99_033835 [Puccinia graminis f. sp. tritici]|uniref:Uncharacterized protein n=2 Tax=Puccinia graminis f. sp. tritici TaxID=56615 RepID=A0A5B0RIG1_PUCGR|nr:hypothetical protein PGTUg99_033835 [Puccinia graminis f. sp. tritici]